MMQPKADNKNVPGKKPSAFRRWTTMLLVLLSAGTVQAQQQPVQLRLKDALNGALEANQNARKARLDVENAGYKIDEVRSRALPQINGSATLTHNPLLQMSAL